MKRIAIIILAFAFSSCSVPVVEKSSEPVIAGDSTVEVARLSLPERAVIQAVLEHEAQGHKESSAVIICRLLRPQACSWTVLAMMMHQIR